MCDPVRALDLAQRFRRDALQTQLPEYSSCMLRAAEELEELARGHYVAPIAPLLQLKAG
jgi:hypothetical protein